MPFDLSVEVLAFLVLGAFAGLLSGMFGIGGGVVIVPTLTVILGFELQNAIGTSLMVLVWPLTIFAVIQYYRAELLQVKASLLIALGLTGGAIIGAQIALSLPGDTLQRIYGAFLIYVGWRFAEPRKWWAARQHGAPPKLPPAPHLQASWQVLLALGVMAGIASGLFGIGGGLVIVPALVTILKYEQKRAVGTSLAALMPPVGIGAVISYYREGSVELAASTFIALGLIAGTFLGAKIALGLPSSTVKRLYGVFLMLVSLRFILQL